MIVPEHRVAISQKHEPLLCLIKPEIDLDSQTLTLTFYGNSKICSAVERY